LDRRLPEVCIGTGVVVALIGLDAATDAFGDAADDLVVLLLFPGLLCSAVFDDGRNEAAYVRDLHLPLSCSLGYRVWAFVWV
jgi:hypothetical protein